MYVYTYVYICIIQTRKIDRRHVFFCDRLVGGPFGYQKWAVQLSFPSFRFTPTCFVPKHESTGMPPWPKHLTFVTLRLESCQRMFGC